MLNRALVSLVVVIALDFAPQAQERKWIEGMWSDPPVTLLGTLCRGHCSPASIETLNRLLDDPKNDSRPTTELLDEASRRYEADLRDHLVPAVLKDYPPDPADDPSFLNCVPYDGPRQMFSRHQLQVTALGRDRLELRYGEWDVRRTVFMDGRKKPENFAPTRLGFSTGHWEGDTLVIESAGFTAGWGPDGIPFSNQMHIVERYTRGEDGKTLWLTATLSDTTALREPIVLKKLWRWAPESEIAPVVDCEKPTSVRRRGEAAK